MREDTGERVLVGDSRRLRRTAAVPRPGGRRSAAADAGCSAASRRGSPRRRPRCTRYPTGSTPAGAAMAEPLAAARARGRARAGRALAPDAGVLGGGPMGQMLAALLVAEGRTSRSPTATRSAARRPRRSGAWRRRRWPTTTSSSRPSGGPRPGARRSQACAPGGCVVLVGGCAAGSDARCRPRPLHYDELDVRGAFHHSPAEVDRALALLAAGTVDWRALAAGPIGLDELPAALAAGNGGPARKWVVEPR